MGIRSKIALVVCGVALVIGGLGSASSANNATKNGDINKGSHQNSSENYTIQEHSVPKEPKIEVKTEEVHETVPFETTTIEDTNLPKGQTRVVTEGSNGVKTIIYSVTYTDGIETNRGIIEAQTTKQPVNRVIAKGTYTAPVPQSQTSSQCANGTYVNSAGNTVCRPSSSNTGGATAICRDGSYSYSQSRRGTCSHHGGVRTWL